MHMCISADADYQNVSKSARVATDIKVICAFEFSTAHSMRKPSGLMCPSKNTDLHISYGAYMLLFELLPAYTVIRSEVE